MRRQGDEVVGWRLATGAVLIVAVLIVALAATVAGTIGEVGPRRQLHRTVGLAAETAQLRIIVGELGDAQAVVALDVVTGRPAAWNPAGAHRAAVARALARAQEQLRRVHEVVVTDEDRDRAAAVARALAAYDAADRRAAAELGDTGGTPSPGDHIANLDTLVDRYQAVTGAVVALDGGVAQRSIRLSDDVAGAGSRARLVHVTVTAVLLTVVTALAAWLVRADRERRRLTDRLRQEAERDHLTGVANRRRWERCLDDALREARRTAAPLSAVLIDLDHFKRYNDTYGHPAGDEHLRQVAAALVSLVGSVDRVARLGGEEFALLLAGRRPTDAARLVETLRPTFPHGQTFSAGVAGWETGETAAALMGRADLALYRAKEHGRDRVAVDA